MGTDSRVNLLISFFKNFQKKKKEKEEKEKEKIKQQKTTPPLSSCHLGRPWGPPSGGDVGAGIGGGGVGVGEGERGESTGGFCHREGRPSG